MSYLFHLFFYDPLYNGLIALLSLFSHPDVGVAVIIFTLIIRLILFPLSKGAVRTQMKLKQAEPELTRIKELYKNDREKQAKEMIALYRQYGINPFASFLLVLIQLPIILALYFIFLNGGLPSVDTSLLYSFVHAPSFIDINFLGFLDMSKPQVFLGILAGISQFAQVQFSIPPVKKVDNPTFKDDLARSMNIQMRYILPLFIFLISFTVSGAVTLYWITGNIFTIGQELYMRRVIKKEGDSKALVSKA